MTREIAIFGLGRMGQSLAREFSNRGGQVIAIDKDPKVVEEISDCVAYAIRADVTDEETVKQLGISNVDAGIVTMSEHLEASIIAVMMCKEMGIPYVIAKAQTKLQADILTKVGADRIIFPEVQMGERLAASLLYGNYVDIVTVAKGVSMIETKTPEKWVGKNLIELDLRKKYGFNVIAIEKDGKLTTEYNVEKPLKKDATMVIIGQDVKIEKIFKK